MQLAYLPASREGTLWSVNFLFLKQNLLSENMLNWEVERNETYKWIAVCGPSKAILLSLRQNYSGLTWLSGSLNLKRHQCPSLMFSDYLHRLDSTSPMRKSHLECSMRAVLSWSSIFLSLSPHGIWISEPQPWQHIFLPAMVPFPWLPELTNVV